MAELLSTLPASVQAEALDAIPPRELEYAWWFWGRVNQQLPRDPFLFLVALAGRGWGKTRFGAEGVREWARTPTERILLIGPTAADVRDTMIEGPSGLLSCYPPDRRPVYNPSRHLIHFPSGAIGITRSADEPERLRGPQFTKFWADEPCAWNYLKEAWDQISFGFRLRTARLQGLLTTTPKPLDVLKRIIANPKTITIRGSSHENRNNLSEQYYSDVIAPYEGTRIGRQEVYAEILDDTPGALWTLKLIDDCRRSWPDKLTRVVVAIDPAVSAGEDSDETGIIVAGLHPDGHGCVLADLTGRYTPAEWGRIAVKAYHEWRADRIVAEVNNGGDLVEANLRAVDGTIPFTKVHASRGKAIRAEPVAALYERGMVHHCRPLKELEDQMLSFVPGAGGRSPDRMDALVWAITELMLREPQARIITRVDPLLRSVGY